MNSSTSCDWIRSFCFSLEWGVISVFSLGLWEGQEEILTVIIVNSVFMKPAVAAKIINKDSGTNFLKSTMKIKHKLLFSCISEPPKLM